MARMRSAAVLQQVNTLFSVGSVAGLTDGQLLERFVSLRGEAAEAAFVALVARHGPMVLGVCRRVLDDPHDIEDAFQTTFLVLVRKAGSIRVDDTLGRWLYGVTSKVAIRARTLAARRRKREETAGLGMPEKPPSFTTESAVIAALDDELARLPEKYRAPIVLCYLQGKTHDEAARLLRWPVGTVRGRLARARERLRARLRGRGFGAASVMVATGLLPSTARAAVPERLIHATVRAAYAFEPNSLAPAGAVSASVTALANDVLRSMFMSKIRLFAGSALLCGLVVTSAGVLAQVPGPAPRQDGSTSAERLDALEKKLDRLIQALEKSQTAAPGPQATYYRAVPDGVPVVSVGAGTPSNAAPGTAPITDDPPSPGIDTAPSPPSNSDARPLAPGAPVPPGPPGADSRPLPLAPPVPPPPPGASPAVATETAPGVVLRPVIVDDPNGSGKRVVYTRVGSPEAVGPGQPQLGERIDRVEKRLDKLEKELNDVLKKLGQPKSAEGADAQKF